MRTPLEIAESLAEREAPIADGTYNNGNDWCLFCNATVLDRDSVTEHYGYCVWRQAKEWYQGTLEGIV